jgi:hypothetical protein
VSTTSQWHLSGDWFDVCSCDIPSPCRELRGVERAPIRIEVSEDLSSFRAEVTDRVTAVADALTGPTTPPGARVQLVNPPGSEVGPGQVATWAVATTDHVDAAQFRFQWQWDGRSSKHIPFDWSGPDS